MIYFLSRAFIFIWVLFPQIAFAHSPIKGMGDFANGMIHPFLVPAQVLLIVALGLWFGQHQPAKNTHSVMMFLAATIAGLIASRSSIQINISVLLLVSSALVGLVVVTGINLPGFVFMLCSILTGFIIGLDSTPDEISGKLSVASLFGSGVGIYFMFLYAMAASESFSHRHWQTIVIRVVASWVSASALMVLALAFVHKV